MARRAIPVAVLLAIVTGCGGGTASGGSRSEQASPTTPEPAVAPVDFFAVGTPTAFGGFTSGATVLDPLESSLIGPHGAFVLGRVATATAIEPPHAARFQVPATPTAVPVEAEPTPGGDEPGWRAADGYEFLVLRTGDLPTPHRARLIDPVETEIEVAIHAGDQTYQLDPRSVHADTLGLGTATLVMSVAKGADVVMVLTDAGRAQSLDLRTGERGDDAAPEFYAAPRGRLDGKLSAPIEVTGLGLPDDDSRVEGEVTSAGLHPYLPDHGWAEPGRAWLQVTLDEETWTGDGALLLTAVITLDTAGSFAVVEPSGGTTRAEPDELRVRVPIPGSPTAPVGGPVVFDVADDLRSGTLTFAPHGTIERGRGEGTVAAVTPSVPIEIELTEGP